MLKKKNAFMSFGIFLELFFTNWTYKCAIWQKRKSNDLPGCSSKVKKRKQLGLFWITNERNKTKCLKAVEQIKTRKIPEETRAIYNQYINRPTKEIK